MDSSSEPPRGCPASRAGAKGRCSALPNSPAPPPSSPNARRPSSVCAHSSRTLPRRRPTPRNASTVTASKPSPDPARQRRAVVAPSTGPRTATAGSAPPHAPALRRRRVPAGSARFARSRHARTRLGPTFAAPPARYGPRCHPVLESLGAKGEQRSRERIRFPGVFRSFHLFSSAFYFFS